jgi:site-specific DNA-methyltransferase (adenine-specific)
MLYNPQDLQKIDKKWKNRHLPKSEHNNHRPSHTSERTIEYGNYPESILRYSNSNINSLHPTQKPVELFEYLIKTYTNEGDLVLDSCIGSVTTAIACMNTNRNFIGIEKEEKYCVIGQKRINDYREQLKLF